MSGKIIIRTGTFDKHFRSRISRNPKLKRRFVKRTKMFLINTKYPLLRDHQLRGSKLAFRAFCISGDIRVIYKKIEDYYVFVDIGNHNQVY